MPDALQNQQFVNNLFDPMVQLVQQHGARKVALAQQQIEREDALNARAQQLQMQQAQLAQTRELANLNYQGQRERDQMYLDREDARIAGQKSVVDARTAKDAKVAKRQAYALYATEAAKAGVTPQPIDKFGDDDEQAISDIGMAASELRRKSLVTAATGMRDRFQKLNGSLANLEQRGNEDDAQRAHQAALGAIGDDKAADTFDKLYRKVGQDAFTKLQPAQRRAYAETFATTLDSLRTTRLKSPEYARHVREIQDLQTKVIPLIQQNPELSNIFMEEPAEKAPAAPRAQLPTGNTLTGYLANLQASRPAPAPLVVPQQNPQMAPLNNLIGRAVRGGWNDDSVDQIAAMRAQSGLLTPLRTQTTARTY